MSEFTDDFLWQRALADAQEARLEAIQKEKAARALANLLEASYNNVWEQLNANQVKYRLLQKEAQDMHNTIYVLLRLLFAASVLLIALSVFLLIFT